MDDVNPSLMRPSGGDLRPESIPVTSQARSLKRQGDGSLSDEQLLKRKRAVLKYAPLDPSGIFLGKRPRQIAFIPRESDKGDILLDKFEPDSVNWYVPSKAKENKNATMGVTACDRESLEAFRKTVELMAMETEESLGCIYFKWNIEFVTSAEHEEQKRALLRTESQPKPNLPKIEPAMTKAKGAQPEPVVNRPREELPTPAMPAMTQAKPTQPEPVVKRPKAEPPTPAMPTLTQAKPAQPEPAVNLPNAPVQPVVTQMTLTVAQSKPDPTPQPALLKPELNLPKAQPVATQVPTIAQPKPADLFAKPPITQSKPDQLEVKPPLPEPKVNLPATELFGKVMATAMQPQLKPNVETAVTQAKPTATQGTPTLTQATPALSQPKPGTLVSTGFRFSSPTLTRLEELIRRTGGPCASCNNPDHVVAVCPCPTEAPFGAIPFCPVHNSRGHSFDECEQTKLRIHLSDVTALPNTGSNTKLPAQQFWVIKDIPYFIHYLIKNRVNRPPILSAKVCWLNLAVQSPVEMSVADPRGFPWTKEFSRMVRSPYVFEELCHGKVHWSRWDPKRHHQGNLPVDPALRYKETGQIKGTAQIRQELSDGRLKPQTIVN